jgi:hypothetical protein
MAGTVFSSGGRTRFFVACETGRGSGPDRGSEMRVQSGDRTHDASGSLTIDAADFRALMQETRRCLGKQLEILNAMRARVGERPLLLIERRAA